MSLVLVVLALPMHSLAKSPPAYYWYQRTNQGQTKTANAQGDTTRNPSVKPDTYCIIASTYVNVYQ